MEPLRIYYYSERYQSLNRAAKMYQSLIKSCSEVLLEVYDADSLPLSVEKADVIILHVFPYQIGEIYNLYPQLQDKYVVSYLVWETSDLPRQWEIGLRLVQEIWTSSKYCIEIFKKYHNDIFYIPHVIERNTYCSVDDSLFVKNIIKYDEACKYFLVIASSKDVRKNVGSLVKTFLKVRTEMKDARLIIKSCWKSDSINYIDTPEIIYLWNNFTDQQLNALYKVADVFISTHHSEGWGFTLSDAMIFKIPIIATRYSGNLEYMNERNSFLVDCEEEYIRPEDVTFPFLEYMRWAYLKDDDLEKKIIELYNNIKEGWVMKRVERANKDIGKFRREFVKDLIESRIRMINQKCKQKILNNDSDS